MQVHEDSFSGVCFFECSSDTEGVEMNFDAYNWACILAGAFDKLRLSPLEELKKEKREQEVIDDVKRGEIQSKREVFVDWEIYNYTRRDHGA